MSEVLPEKTAGVGSFIIFTPLRTVPETLFLTIKENRTKYATHKRRGMRSFPMETVEEGETHEQALGRLNEEVRVRDYVLGYPPSKSFEKQKLAICELRPGTFLHSYLFFGDFPPEISPGSETDEVSDPQLTKIGEVLNDPIGTLRFRPGVKETVRAYQDWRSSANPANFEPHIYRYHQLIDPISTQLWDMLNQAEVNSLEIGKSPLFYLPRSA